jgi:hypothetical protein
MLPVKFTKQTKQPSCVSKQVNTSENAPTNPGFVLTNQGGACSFQILGLVERDWLISIELI